MSDYDFIPFVFVEELYYIDAVKSEWEILINPIEEKDLDASSETNKASKIGDVSEKALQNDSSVSAVSEEQTFKKAKTPQKTHAVSYLGRNRKHFLILTNDAQNEFLSSQDNDLLSGILQSGHMSLADVAIINVHRTKVDFLTIYNLLKPAYVLNFGTDLSSLGIDYDFNKYQPKAIKNTTWLLSDVFSELHQAKSKKFALWQSLKKLDCYTG